VLHAVAVRSPARSRPRSRGEPAGIEAGRTAAEQRTEIELTTIEQYAAPTEYDPPSYAQGVKVSDAQTVLFISGQVSYDEYGNPAHPHDFAAQARSVFRALTAQVEAGGGTLRNVVKLNTYLTDIRYRADLVPIREEFFGPRTPATTQVAVTALGRPEWLIEVEAIAVI
jgi:2-iminobutanoate/2-iminopropanoate deaminase